MQVRVLFFGVLREMFGTGERTCELSGDSCLVAALLAHLRALAPAVPEGLWPRLAVAVNREYAQATDRVRAGDEVALLPPVSGGAPDRVRLTREAIDAGQLVAALKAAPDGAVVVFDGIVRNHTRGRRTLFLVYEAYEEMALEHMERLAGEARQRFGVRDVLLHHRLGRLDVGETSVLIAVASAHRAAAFEACRWLIDTLKQQVPVWKQEHFEDGAIWVDGEPFPPDMLPGSGEA